MLLFNNLGVNDKNNLTIGGVDVSQLANEYKTPLYLMDEDVIRNNCRIYKNALDEYYDGNGMVLYASKAFCCLYICNVAKQEGLGLYFVSGG